MKKKITTIMLAIMMLAGASAMFAGETITFETNITNPVYTITGNHSDMSGLTVEFENGNITVSTVLNFKPDNFTIVLFDEKTREIVKTIGGGGSTRYVDRNVTVYEPEYINTTEILEVEKIVDNETIIHTGYEWWQLVLAMVIGVGFGCFIMAGIKSDKKKE